MCDFTSTLHTGLNSLAYCKCKKTPVTYLPSLCYRLLSNQTAYNTSAVIRNSRICFLQVFKLDKETVLNMWKRIIISKSIAQLRNSHKISYWKTNTKPTCSNVLDKKILIYAHLFLQPSFPSNWEWYSPTHTHQLEVLFKKTASFRQEITQSHRQHFSKLLDFFWYQSHISTLSKSAYISTARCQF